MVASIGHLVLDVVRTTILQRVVPDAYRGRFTGVLMTTSGGAEALGTLVVPILAVVVGLPTVMNFTAVALVVGSLLSVWLIGRAGMSRQGRTTASFAGSRDSRSSPASRRPGSRMRFGSWRHLPYRRGTS